MPVIIAIAAKHYVVAFGTAVTKKTDGRVNKQYYMVTDNGVETEIYNYRPYMRVYNGWNLHYGLKIKD